MSPQYTVRGEPLDLAAAQAILASNELNWAAPGAFINALQLDAIATVFTDAQNRPLHAVRLTLPVAKTYAVAIAQLIAEYERTTGQTVLTLDELQKKLASAGPAST